MQEQTDNLVTEDVAAQALKNRGYTLIRSEYEGRALVRLLYGETKVCTATNAAEALEFVEMTEKLPRA